MLQAAVEKLARRARRARELVQTHAAQALAADVELLEGDAAGVQLVGVQEVLEPLPHLVLGPVLRVDFMPLASEKPAGNCKTGGGPVSDPRCFRDIISDVGGIAWLPDVGTTPAGGRPCGGSEPERALERRFPEMGPPAPSRPPCLAPGAPGGHRAETL